MATDAAASKARFEVYEDSAEQYRWRLRHDNGNIIADSGEGYATKQKAENGLESVKSNAPGAYVVEVVEERVVEVSGESTYRPVPICECLPLRLRHDVGEIIADCGLGSASIAERRSRGSRASRRTLAGQVKKASKRPNSGSFVPPVRHR